MLARSNALTLPLPPASPLRTEAREELRRQVGNLRFDLNTLAQAKPKEEKKKALELRKDFIAKVRGGEGGHSTEETGGRAVPQRCKAKSQERSLGGLHLYLTVRRLRRL